MSGVTSRLVSRAAFQHWLKLNSQFLCRCQSTAVSPYKPTGDAAVKWNPQLDRTKPDYTTPMDKKTLEAKIDFYTKMKDPKEDLLPVTPIMTHLKPDLPHKESVWELWGSMHYPKDVIGRWPEDWKQFPERDTKNYPHQEIKDFGPRVRMGFIPDSWFQFFYDRTGVTGPYLLGFGTLMFLMQKEILVWEHGFKRIYVYMLIIPWIAGLANRIYVSYLDKVMINEINYERNAVKQTISSYRNALFEQQGIIDFAKVANVEIFKAKHENVDLQLETEYRQRLKSVHADVKKRLDYLVELDSSRRRFEHRHMVDWIVNEVKKSITPQLEKAILDQCFTDLKLLTQKL